MSKPNLCRVIVSCWYIWFHRNTCASNGMVQDPRTAMFRISSLLSPYQSNNSALLHGPHSHLFDWCRPPEQFIKVNCDASWSHDDMSCGIGAWARDHDAATLAVRSKVINDSINVTDAEREALKLGMELAHDLKQTNVIFESDRADIVTTLNYKTNSALWGKGWFIFCCRLLRLQPNWKIHLIRREVNGQAGALARKSRFGKWQWTRLDTVPCL
ncbi:hypothetical protein QQ045_028315 [Rhodiola kirilowii]